MTHCLWTRPFCCEFNGGVGLVDFFYKAGQTFFSMIPKGEYVINLLALFWHRPVVVVQVCWGY